MQLHAHAADHADGLHFTGIVVRAILPTVVRRHRFNRRMLAMMKQAVKMKQAIRTILRRPILDRYVEFRSGCVLNKYRGRALMQEICVPLPPWIFPVFSPTRKLLLHGRKIMPRLPVLFIPTRNFFWVLILVTGAPFTS